MTTDKIRKYLHKAKHSAYFKHELLNKSAIYKIIIK